MPKVINIHKFADDQFVLMELNKIVANQSKEEKVIK